MSRSRRSSPTCASAATRHCASGRCGSTASRPHARCRGRAAGGGDARARRPRAPVARGAAPGRRAARDRAGRRARAALGAAPLGRDLRAAAARLDARHVRSAGARRGRGADRRRHAARRCRARRRGGAAARRRRGLGGRRRARGRRARLWHGDDRARRQDRRPGNAYVNEAKLLVSRDVAIDLRRDRRRSPSCSAAAATADRGARARGAGRARARGVCTLVDGDDLDRRSPRSSGSRRSTSSCSARRALAGRMRNAGAVFVGESSPVAAGDYATGGNHVLPTGGWAAGGGLGLETFLKPVTVQRLTPAGLDRARRSCARSPRSRACPRTRRRWSDEAAPAGFRPYAWAPSTEELARRAGLDPVEIVRFDGNVPPLPLPSSRPGAIAGALARINKYPHGGYPELVAAIAAYAGVEPENVVLGAGADDLILLVARAFAGPATRSRSRTSRRIRSSASPPGSPARRSATRARAHVLLPAGQPDRRARPLPAARPLAVDEAYFEFARTRAPSGSSTTASSSSARSRRRSGSPARASAMRSRPPTSRPS